MIQSIKMRWVIGVTFIWSWLVILLGAYTRLNNAGLGCPDWPACYGHMLVTGGVVNHFKAWLEMAHRYVAGILVVGIVATLVVVYRNRRSVRPMQWVLAGLLLLLLAYQPLLGMWTVTLKLHPLIVSQHLLSGYSLMILLGVQWLYFQRQSNISRVWGFRERSTTRLCIVSAVGLLLVYLQLALGAWTSTNYAALSCSAFPFCQLHPWSYHFSEAFNLLRPVGLNYDGGVLSVDARQTIQMVHRFGAMVVFGYLFAFSVCVVLSFPNSRLAIWSFIMKMLLVLQVALGIGNALLARPVLISMLHTFSAAALLVVVVILNFKLWSMRDRRVIKSIGEPS